ncbi:MAG: membrane dipeptidase [Clostridia bacterium]|nr:membrane dipeptidase [Clostridia bacterium]
MLICDTHADTLFTAAMEPEKKRDVTLDTLKKGGVNLQTLAMFVGDSKEIEAIRDCFGKMYKALDEFKQQGWKQVLSLRDAKEGETAFLLSVEGCDLLYDGMDIIDQWYNMGVRMAALTWNYQNVVATPACVNDTDKLTLFGVEVCRKLAEKKMAIDVSHLNEGGFWDLLDKGFVPLASHSCCRALCDHKRNLTDEQLKKLFEAGGYVGVNFFGRFLAPKGDITLELVADHLEHMLEMGGEGKIGFGSDFDGCSLKPIHLDDPSGLPLLMDVCNRRFGEKITRGIAGENLLKYYDRI